MPIETSPEILQTTETSTVTERIEPTSTNIVLTSTKLNEKEETSFENDDSTSLIRISATSLPLTSLNVIISDINRTPSVVAVETKTVTAATEAPPHVQFVQKNVTSLALSQNNNEDEETEGSKNESNNLNLVQNLRSMNLLKTNASEPLVTTQEASSSGYNLQSRASTSPKLSVALYIVIALLCLSLLVNIALLYVSKQKQWNREKLIIRHEICDTKSENTQSQRSGINSHNGELHDCNINLINSSSDSAASTLDIEQ